MNKVWIALFVSLVILLVNVAMKYVVFVVKKKLILQHGNEI